MLSRYFKVAAFFALTILLACGGSGCSSSNDAAPTAGAGDDGGLPAFNSIDTSVQCPAGQIGWNFTTGGTSTSDIAGSPDNGIQILTASFGLNCNSSLYNDSQYDVIQHCNGLTECAYKIGQQGDPMVGCVKNFTTTWRCGNESTTYTGQVAGNSSGQTFKYECGPPITVVTANYGQNCGVAGGNVNAPVKQACDGTRACSFVVQGVNNVDPAPDCAKDFQALYTCGTNPKQYQVVVPKEAGGKTVSFACSGTPAINVEEATWGLNCGVTEGNVSSSIGAQCNGLQTCAPTLTTPDPAYGCAKNLYVKYDCGNGQVYASNFPPEASREPLSLNCTGVTAYAVGNTAVSTGKKGCVPRTCPYNTTRDPDTLQCTPAKKALLTSASLQSWDLGQNIGTTTYFSDSAPRVNGVPSVGPYTTIKSLHMNAPTGVFVRLLLSGDPVKGNVEPYLTTRFINYSTGQAVDGFLCALSPMGIDFPGSSTPTLLPISQPTTLPSQCLDARSNPAADAAARLGMKETDFHKVYSYAYERLHFAIDPEGNFGIATAAAGTPNAPNPPGFFFNPAINSTSLVDFYAQRELKTFTVDSFSNTLPSPLNVSDAAVYHAETYYGNIDVSLLSATLRSGAALDVDFFDTLAPVIAVDTAWQMIGDNPINPLSPTTTVPRTGVQTLAQRNLRVTAEIYPGNDPTKSMPLGSIPLSNGVPTGSSVSGSYILPPAVRAQMFTTYASTTSWGLKVCMDLDGANTRSTSEVDITATSAFGATLHTSCFLQNDAFVVTRELIQRPIPVQQPTLQTGATNNSANGDGNNKSANNSGTDKKCVRQTVAGGTQDVCTQDSSATNQSSGTASNGTLYSAGASAVTTVGPTGRTNATVSADGEAYGFQILDPNDPADGVNQDITNTQTFTISPNWDAIVQALKKEEATQEEDPVQTKASLQKFGEHQGMGLAVGVRVKLGEFGEVELGFGVGVSLAFTFQVTTAPSATYPCINSTGQPCYEALPNAATQTASQKACQVLGGELAEASDPVKFAAINAVAKPGTQYWTAGQLDYQYPNVQCAEYPTSTGCAAQIASHFRWLNTDAEFALGTPYPGVPSYMIVAPTGKNLGAPTTLLPGVQQSQYPASQGLVYTGNATFLVAPQSSTHPAICEFDSAPATRYLGTSFSVPISAGAGLTLQYCWPSSEVGLCIVGSLNFVTLSMTPTVMSTVMSLLNTSNQVVATRADTNVAIPWELDLLGGEIDVVANFFFFSISYPLWSYPPFVAASGSLANYDWPSQENCQGTCQ